MKILLISYELPNIERIRGWDTWCTYFLDKAFRSKNIEVINVCFKKDKPIPEIPKVDFIISVMRIKYIIDNFGKSIFNILKERSNNRICSYGDIIYNELIDQTIFSVLSGEDQVEGKYYKIWWCGDNEFLYPEHDLEKFYILLDHIHYSSDKYDFIYDIYRQALKNLSQKYNLEVKIIADPNVVDFDLNKKKKYPYSRSRNRWLDIIPFYRKAHIFCVTHMELGGLSVMETAWCGASIIIPDKYISDKLSSEVNAYHCDSHNVNDIERKIELSIKEYNISKNLKIARAKSWSDVVDKIVNVMTK